MTTAKNMCRPAHRPATTGIGSLPHHNVDAALEYSFQMGIPFLPQIPIRNPWEYMIAQALEGLPGLQADPDGSVTLNTDIWLSRAADFGARLEAALKPGAPTLENFEPSAAISSSWQPFIWELQERGATIAKIQLAGPMTAQWVLKLKDSSGKEVAAQAFGEQNPELSSQIVRLVLVRALAMSRHLQEAGIQPLLFLDEPGLYVFSLANPRHVLALQELKLILQTLRKEGVLVGLHCCSDADWRAILGLPIHYLSLDTSLSLGSLLRHQAELKTFLNGGGKLSLGVIPTGRSSVLHSLDVRELFDELVLEFAKAWSAEPKLIEKTLKEAIYTPACGLALQSVADADLTLDYLTQFEALIDVIDLPL